MRSYVAIGLSFVAFGAAPVLFSGPVRAFGSLGHRVAGLVAEAHLCEAAQTRVARLGAGDGLDRLGLWADRIRDTDDYAHTGPWHYLNIDDGGSLARYTTPADGDVLWAIENFRAVLADGAGSISAQREALRFLAHFVVDVHQPLHVGRAADRGGNSIEVSFGRERSNLHRFWDTDAIDLDAGSAKQRAERLLSRIAAEAWSAGQGGAISWATESLNLRFYVYDFDARRGRLTQQYVDRARRITSERLGMAGLRLAATLNSLYCSD